MDTTQSVGLVAKTVEVEYLVSDGERRTATVRELSIKELEQVRRKADSVARSGWQRRLRELSEGLPPAEQRRLIVEAAEHEPDLSDEVRKWICGPDGIGYVLAMASAELKRDWEAANSVDRNSDAFVQAWFTAMGVDPDKQKDTKEAKEAAAAGPGGPLA